MGPRRGEHLLGRRERSRVLSPIRPRVGSQLAASGSRPQLLTQVVSPYSPAGDGKLSFLL